MDINDENKPLARPGVYLITNKANGKQYVGISNSVRKRYNEHHNGKSPRKLKSAIAEYGIQVFVFEPIYYSLCGSEHLAALESELICSLCTSGEGGYNVLLADGRVGPYGDEHRLAVVAAHARPEVRERVMAAAKVRAASSTYRAALSKARRQPDISKKISDSAKESWKVRDRESVRLQMISQNLNPENAEKRNIVMQSAEYREKMSASLSRLIWITNGVSAQRIPKDSIIPDGWVRGRGLSDEARKKIGDGQKRRASEKRVAI